MTSASELDAFDWSSSFSTRVTYIRALYSTPIATRHGLNRSGFKQQSFAKDFDPIPDLGGFFKSQCLGGRLHLRFQIRNQ